VEYRKEKKMEPITLLCKFTLTNDLECLIFIVSESVPVDIKKLPLFLKDKFSFSFS